MALRKSNSKKNEKKQDKTTMDSFQDSGVYHPEGYPIRSHGRLRRAILLEGTGAWVVQSPLVLLETNRRGSPILHKKFDYLEFDHVKKLS
jgi:hypothetical protein